MLPSPTWSVGGFSSWDPFRGVRARGWGCFWRTGTLHVWRGSSTCRVWMSQPGRVCSRELARAVDALHHPHVQAPLGLDETDGRLVRRRRARRRRDPRRDPRGGWTASSGGGRAHRPGRLRRRPLRPRGRAGRRAHPPRLAPPVAPARLPLGRDARLRIRRGPGPLRRRPHALAEPGAGPGRPHAPPRAGATSTGSGSSCTPAWPGRTPSSASPIPTWPSSPAPRRSSSRWEFPRRWPGWCVVHFP